MLENLTRYLLIPPPLLNNVVLIAPRNLLLGYQHKFICQYVNFA